jgi:hypothetical protein
MSGHTFQSSLVEVFMSSQTPNLVSSMFSATLDANIAGYL